MEKKCVVCNETFNVRPSHYHIRITCSKTCGSVRQSIFNKGEANPNYKNAGSLSSQNNAKPLVVCSPGSFCRCFNCVKGVWKRLQATQFYEAIELCPVVNVWCFVELISSLNY